MDTSNPSVILHTYQQPEYPVTDFSASNSFATGNNWTNPGFSSGGYSDGQFGNEISVLSYPGISSNGYEDSSSMSDPSLIGSNSSSSTSDGSSIDCSMSPEPILMPSVKRGRPTENPCWAYFHRIDDQLVKCRICTKVVRSACATNMTKHLERHHLQDFEKVSGQIKLYRMNDAGIRSKMQYQPAENPLTTIPVLTNSYIVPKMEVIEPFENTNYYTVDEQVQPFVQFEQQDVNQWPIGHFWPANGPIGEASTSSIATTVIQKVNADGTMVSGQKNGAKPTKLVNGVEKPYMKRNRKTEHPVWEFFKRTGDGNAACTICQGVVKSPCSSNFMRHLMRHHTAEYNDVYTKWIQKRNVTHPGVQCTSVPAPHHH